MTATELKWFKSSYSASNSNDCVEIAVAPAVVHVRDSKDRGGACLGFARDPWAEFVAYAVGC
ncbi:DUF397 domain-containing protein [Streptomyces sp. NBC_01387]|uniref:DUF397 domain-containing protein n=1 Tax=unclassified Streptomyces TaxID=2593676 RepID=UPI002DDB3150|nr:MULTISPECIES: DUF397 domain-containing protein [unclassified Streptomyces]WSC21956.1 DUF397 domain-containing protein [Streptomyces sp. NBC_01766]WSV55911.1 DUF397 domain-containing protein [Streptomyces sp. NBC_01014]